jgi:excisionase family DNA binding protein
MNKTHAPRQPAPLLSVQQAADRTGVSTETIRRWIRIGELPARRVGPRLIRIRVEDLDALFSPAVPL